MIYGNEPTYFGRRAIDWWNILFFQFFFFRLGCRVEKVNGKLTIVGFGAIYWILPLSGYFTTDFRYLGERRHKRLTGGEV
jgi:hypothetical protein